MTLQEKIEQYNRNFEAIETALADASLIDESLSADRQLDLTRKALISALPVAVGTLINLAQNAKAESVRLRAAQYLIDRGLGPGTMSEEDEVVKLLRRLGG